MGVTVLSVNSGSSSLKLSVLGPSDELLAHEELSSTSEDAIARGLQSVLSSSASDVGAVGHRLVHGGLDLRRATVIDPGVRTQLEAAASFAAQHVPKALSAVDIASSRLASVPHVACFDTSFHESLAGAATTYALPAGWRRRWPQLRRFGFHGLSYAHALRRSSALLDRDPRDLELVIVHLGGGCSACAVKDGRSVDTTMGLTPLEGLVMGRRSGSVDPGLLIWLLENGMPVDELADGLQRSAGLLGLSDGASNDTRELLSAADNGDETARLAMDVFTRSAQRHVAAMASALGRLDALVFTGEMSNSHAAVRERVCAGLGVLGIEPSIAGGTGEDAILTPASASVAVLSIRTREHLEIARETRRVLNAMG